MKKLLSYFKLLSSIALLGAPMAYGMEEKFSPGDNKITHQLASTQNKESWVHNNGVLKLLTVYLYYVNHLNTHSFGKDINSLTQVNKALNDYYSDEQRAKSIIRGFAEVDKYASENRIARDLLPTGVFRAIYNKINYLFSIIDKNEKLTENDLLDPWFIDATKHVSYDDQPGAIIRQMVETFRRSTLLAEACREGQLDNAFMLKNCSDIKKCSPSLLIEIAQERYRTDDEDVKKAYLAIAQLLLEKKMDPNYRYWSRNPTALMVAVHNADKEFAKLLLSYDADPNQKGLSTLLGNPAFCPEDIMKEYFKDALMEDAFQIAQGVPKDWLKVMVDEKVIQDKK